MPGPAALRFALAFDPADIPRLARRYRPEEDEKALAAGARIRGGRAGRLELGDIYDWKTKGRGRSRLAANTDAEIADALRLALAARTERAAMAVLLGLVGVDVPVASAILTAVDPSRFTVIDFRALEALGCKTRNRTVPFYLDYLHACRGLAAAHGVTLRDLDRALWRWSFEQSQSPRRHPAGRSGRDGADERPDAGALARHVPAASHAAAEGRDALDALDFARRGRPDAEIGYGDDAPRLTPEQLAEFEPAAFRFTKPTDTDDLRRRVRDGNESGHGLDGTEVFARLRAKYGDATRA